MYPVSYSLSAINRPSYPPSSCSRGKPWKEVRPKKCICSYQHRPWNTCILKTEPRLLTCCLRSHN